MFVWSAAIVLACAATPASAQYGYGYRRSRIAGGAIAGIVIACVAGLLLLCILSTMMHRRRRGAPTLLPGPGGGFFRTNRPMFGNASGPYAGNAGYQPGYGYGAQPINHPVGQQYQPPGGAPGAPLYSGKETYPGQQRFGNGAPQPGGFAPPPGPPPPEAAYVNNGRGRLRWFGNK